MNTYQGQNGKAWISKEFTILGLSEKAIKVDGGWIAKSNIKEDTQDLTIGSTFILQVRKYALQNLKSAATPFTIKWEPSTKVEPIISNGTPFPDVEVKPLELDYTGLYPDQVQAVDEIKEFLQSDRNEHFLTGGAGTGKSHTMDFIINKVFPLYKGSLTSVKVSATTHAAVAVLQGLATKVEVSTIHSLVGAVLNDNYTDGTTTSKLKEDSMFNKPLFRSLIIIDEASMLDLQLRMWIIDKAKQCKILYVGDENQLSQVKGQTSGITTLPTSRLNIIKRSSDTTLINLYTQLESNVKSLKFEPIQTVKGIIDWFSPEEVMEYIDTNITTFTDNNAICNYTNEEVHGINAYCRGIQNLPDHYTAGEKLVVGVSQSLKNGSMVEVVDSDTVHEFTIMPSRHTVWLRTLVVKSDGIGSSHIYVPVVKETVDGVLASYVANKDWKSYFYLKNKLTDVRPMYASTSYKLQGRSVDTILVNLTDMSRCFTPEVMARMLYVGASRAKKRIIFFGQLDPKYGRIV